MIRFRAIFAKEWQQAMGGMTFWISTALMIFALMALVFFVGRVFDAGRADMVLVFGWFPFVCALFLPVTGAGLLARERELGTDKLLPRHGSGVWPLILAKTGALRAQGMVALILLIPFWIMVSWLGQPDQGVILSGFLGASFIISSFASLIVLAGSFRNSTALSALWGILLCLMVLLPLPLAVRSLLPAFLQDGLAGFSAQSHYHAFVRGLIRLSDILYFVSLILLALTLTVRLHGGKSVRNWPVVLAALGFFVIAPVLSPLTSRMALDASSDRTFSLSAQLRQSVQDLPQPTSWTLYYSAAQAAKYPDWREYAEIVRLLLSRMSAASNGKLVIHTQLVLPDTNSEDLARAAGMQAQPTDTGEPMFFGLAEAQKPLIALLSPTAQGQLDLDLALALAHKDGQKPQLGLIDDTDLAGKEWYVTGRKERMSHAILARDFALSEGAKAANAPILLMQHPDKAADAILARRLASDQPLHAMIMVDPWREAASRPGLNGAIRPGAHPVSTIPPALQQVGLHEIPGVVFDPQLAAQSRNPQTGAAEKWPLWLQIPKTEFRPAGLLQSTLSRPLGLASAGALQADPVPGWHWQPVLQTGDGAKMVPADLLANAASLARLRAAAQDPGAKTLMGLLSNPARHKYILVMADTDWLEDEYIGVHDPVTGWRPVRSNIEFLQAALNLLGTNPALLGARAHNIRPHALTRVEKWRETAQAQLDAADTALAKAMSAKSPDPTNIKALQNRARKVRHEFARRMRMMEWGLIFPNLVLLPLLFVLVGFWRNRRH